MTMKPYMYMYCPTNYVAPPEAIYIIDIRMHQGVYEFYKPKGLRL